MKSPRRSRHQRLLFSLISLVIFAILSQVAPQAQQQLSDLKPGEYRVREFYDGDTIGVDMNGRLERIRMIGVDTPETHHPKKPVQCFGKAASEFTKRIISDHGSAVRLEADPLSSNRDRYDRLLRYVYLRDGTLLNMRIIEDGYGFAYTQFIFTKSNDFREVEKIARDSNRGLWASCTP
jgi:micrococcal nuclease